MSKDKLLEIKTKDYTIKSVFLLLSKILSEANIKFTKGKGMEIYTLAPSRTMMVHLLLNKFNHFYMEEEKINVGVNLITFSQHLSCMDTDTILTFSIDKEEPDHFKITIENPADAYTSEKIMATQDIDDVVIPNPQVTFDTKIEMSSNKFQKIIRELTQQEARPIEIQKVDKTLKFSCRTDIGLNTVIIGESEKTISFRDNSNNSKSDIIQGFYDGKNLASFTKATNLSHSIEIYMKNKCPLMLRYLVGELGDLKLALAPVRNQNMD